MAGPLGVGGCGMDSNREGSFFILFVGSLQSHNADHIILEALPP